MITTITILPSKVTYGTVTGQFLCAVLDSADADTLPDSLPVKGTVTFAPSPGALLLAGFTPPVTILPQPITFSLDSTGSLVNSSGVLGVQLIATDDPALNPSNWTYSVSFNFGPLRYPTFSIQVPGGATVDLTTVAPVPGNAGTPILVGPQGLPGPPGPQGSPATTNASDLTSGTLDPARLPDLSGEYAAQANNLSDLPSKPTARTNLGLGDIATHAASEFPALATSTATGLHKNTDSPTYGAWFTFGNAPNSMGFSGRGTPAEAYAPIVFYQDFGDKAGGSGAAITKTTQGFAQLCNYWGPTTDDAAQASSRFIGMKAVTGGYAQTRQITGDEIIVQLEAGVDASSLTDGLPIVGQGAHINVIGTAHAGTAVMFKANNNVDGGGSHGTIDKFIAFGQLTGAAANGGTVTTAYGMYVVDTANTETALTVGDSFGTYFSAKKTGNNDSNTSFVLAIAPAGSNLTTMTLRAVSGQTKNIFAAVDSGGTTRFQIGSGGNLLLHGQQITVQDSSSVDKIILSPTNGLQIMDGVNVVLATTTGTKIGTSTTQKLAFFNATPIVQPSGTPSAATDLASVSALANSLRTNLLALGLVA